MLIKHKLMLNIVCFISALLIMLGILFFTLNKAAVEVRITRQLADVEYEVSQLSHHQKNFVQLKDEAYVTAFERSIKKIKQDIQSLEKDLGEFGLDISSIKQVEQRLVSYQSLFLKVVEQQKLIGLHPKDGLYGSLRSSVHAVEEILGKNDFELLSGMLQLRRNEKDYMLRLDDKYVTRLQNNTNLLVGKVENSGQSSALKSDIVKLLRAYEADFLNLVSAQKLLGYRHDDAMLGEMQAVVLDIDKRLISILNTTHDHVEAQTASVKTFAFVVLALVIVFAVTLSSFISRSVISVITEMRDLMRKVASTNDLTLSAEIKGNDELTEMSKVFNDMLETFRHLIIEANQSVQTVNTATQSLAQNISVANDGVDTQMQQTDMVATAVTQMVATINEIAQNTEEAANKAHSTTENAERGKSGVDTTIDQIKVLSESLSKSESIVSELYKDSHTIGTVLDVIRGIAEQTNLLALNAAIEAARAGEQGRGFAVVADEVRTLASRTQDSTKEIESIILSLQDRTQKIVEYMDTCRKQGNESAEQASSAGQMLEEITADVALIQDMNSAIATAIQQQSSVASEVNEHVVMIRDVTEQSADSSKQNEYMSEELSQQASVLHKEVSRFKV